MSILVYPNPYVNVVGAVMTNAEKIREFVKQRTEIAGKAKPIPGYEGYFLIDDYVVSTKSKKARKISARNDGGYLRVTMIRSKDRKPSAVGMHRVLMLAHKYKIGCEKLVVDHINGDKTDNRLENLRWCTSIENLGFAISSGCQSGIKNHLSVLSEEDVDYIRKEYIPRCAQFGFHGLARKLGVSHGTVQRAFWGETYLKQGKLKPGIVRTNCRPLSRRIAQVPLSELAAELIEKGKV